MNNNVRKLTDGAMMIAIVGVLLLINRQLGEVLTGSLLFIFPLPLVFYSVKYGQKDSWVVFAAVVILAFILGSPSSMIYVAAESMIGICYGDNVRRGTNNRGLLVRAVLLSIIVDIMTMLVFASFFGYDLQAEVAEYQTLLTEAFNNAGTPLPDSVDLAGMLKTVLVVSVLFTGVMEGVVIHLLSRLVLIRLRIPVPKAEPLLQYYPPVWTGYAGIVGLICYYYATLHPLENDVAESLMQGAGLIGTMYLLIFGVIAIILFMRLFLTRSKIFIALVAILMVTGMMLPTAICGFLYITTNWHRNMLEGVKNAAENDKN